MGRKKQTVLMVDIEADNGKGANQLVIDFSAIVVDLSGNIVQECAILINGIYTDRVNHPLFHRDDLAGTVFSTNRLNARYQNYDAMIIDGRRMLATVPAVNRWLAQVNALYNPTLTAYNLSYDVGKCNNTGINLDMFQKRFCLMAACQQQYANKRKYRQFILENHLFNPRTKHGNMTYPTKAETMARYLLGADYPSEPHTGYEDLVGYELPLLVDIIKKRSLKWCLNEVKAGSWERFIVRDNFKVK